ncbi:hypothetical protein UY286_05010 [Paenibacillus polymyxa]|uniref:hypothetical protein n=1 Tax=Paenibacillus polymyxa TaxID=1406 RepID=UPI002AB3787F|nr:hypothetical protein [Paenibacillus polymyxa]MDY7989846.1 hypothetical protein [Paenibacillus polymyxa]MDY8116795.1 hypothetical protein [Paenibacillus polymyxa]
MSMTAFINESALICVIPSSRQNGVYLVQAEPHFNELVITHDCPACHYGHSQCKHVQMAAEAYERWQWWEPKKRVHTVTRKIVLSPNWEQIQLPPSPEEMIRAIVDHAS